MRERDPGHIRLLQLLLHLYPASFRHRHGGAVIESARAAARRPGGARPVAVIVDALLTLVRAWLDVGASALTRPDPRRFLVHVGMDARFALRALRRDPLSAFVLIATLAIAIGANAAIYTVTHALLLEQLPYAHAEHVVEADRAPVDMQLAGGTVKWKPAGVFADHAGVELAATYYVDGGANLVTGDDASRVRITQISPEFFDVLGVRMLLGTSAVVSGGNDAVLSYGLWRSAFGSDAGMHGRTLYLNGQSWRITGVAPEGVDFPAGTQLWLSDPPVGEFFGSALGPSVIARLRPGALAAVRAALVQDAGARRADAGDAARHIVDPTLVPLRAYLTSDVRLPLTVLAGAAALVLLLGCVNVAGLSLARVAVRAPEFATRRALGAGNGRVFGQLLAELTAIAAVAGVLSVLLAMAAVPVLVSLLPAQTPGLATVHADVRTLLFVGGLTVLAAMLAGLPPALAGAWDRRSTLQPDRLRIDDARGHRFQGVLTTAQVALAVTLVAGAALLGRSLAALQAVPLGYDVAQVLTFSVRLPLATYGTAADARRYGEDVRARLEALPGVERVGMAERLPLGDGMGVGGRVRSAGMPLEDLVTASQIAVDAAFFDALGIDVIEGRSFTRDDGVQAVVVSHSLASALFGDAQAVGARVAVRRPGPEIEATVIGVVADIRRDGAESEIRPTIYLPIETTFVTSPSFAIRTAGAPAGLTAAVRRVLADVDPAVAPHELRTTREAVAETLAARRATAIVAVIFGAASLALCVLAVYSLLAQSVARRRRELGIRVALGATAQQLERMVVRRSLGWALPGLAAGIVLSIGATRLLEGLLFGVAPRDPRVLGATVALVLLAALLASWPPARRAGRLDAVRSLRGE